MEIAEGGLTSSAFFYIMSKLFGYIIIWKHYVSETNKLILHKENIK